jgi:hypothetical protein
MEGQTMQRNNERRDMNRGINEECPRFIALVFDRFVEADDDLETLIGLVRADGLRAGEDCTIWEDFHHLAAVVRADGSVHRFEPLATKKGNGLARRHAARSGRGISPRLGLLLAAQAAQRQPRGQAAIATAQGKVDGLPVFLRRGAHGTRLYLRPLAGTPSMLLRPVEDLLD